MAARWARARAASSREARAAVRGAHGWRGRGRGLQTKPNGGGETGHHMQGKNVYTVKYKKEIHCRWVQAGERDILVAYLQYDEL